jgi:putative tricarboxylic transport membrane protein
VRRVLDELYRITLWLSALCLCAIALLVGLQLAGRLLDGTLALLHLPRTDFVILSLNEICGYLLACASFLALAGTLKAGAHIRVTMVLAALGEAASLKSGGDLLARLGDDAQGVTVALSTALGNPNHVALAKLTRQVGGDVNAPVIRVFDTALDCVADVIAGNADVCAVTAANVLAELNAGRLRVLAVSAPARLAGLFANAPTWTEQGADCVIGAWRGVTGAAGLALAPVKFWETVIEAATQQPCWAEDQARLSWSPLVQVGDALRSYLAAERAEFVAVLGELGLLKR